MKINKLVETDHAYKQPSNKFSCRSFSHPRHRRTIIHVHNFISSHTRTTEVALSHRIGGIQWFEAICKQNF